MVTSTPSPPTRVIPSPCHDPLKSLDWKLNVVPGNCAVKKMLKPFVVITLNFVSGRSLTVELTLKRFHQLRHTVASLLKEMQTVNAKYAVQ